MYFTWIILILSVKTKREEGMIDIRSITFRYPGQGRNVFSDFSLSMEEGGVWGLLGKNGTGKSTLLYIISGLSRPRRGEVLVGGERACRRSASMMSELFLVPEEFDLPPVTLSTYVRINEGFYPRFSHEVLDSCLRDFELPASLNLGELSMGQKKKVFMSFALATGTRLLLMDEPTNGLDIPSKSQFRRAVASSMSEGRTVMIATHQVHDVEALVNRVMILSESRLLLNEPTAVLSARYTFGLRMPQEMTSDVVYAEPTLQGNAVIARRKPGEAETPVNLELLFNAVTGGYLNQ